MRCSDVPCVNESGTTVPPLWRCRRSSPIAVAVASGELAALDLGAASTRSVGAFLYLVVFGSILAFNAFVYLLRVVPPARVATYAYVNPLVAVLLGWLFAGEAIGPRAGLATAIILPGVALVTFGRSTPRTAPVPAGDPAVP